MTIKQIFKYLMFIILFIVCFLDSTFIFANSQKGIYVLMIDLLAMFALILISKKKSVDRKKIFLLVSSLFIIILSGLIVMNFKQSFILLILIIIAFFVTNLISFEDFKDKYSKIMFFLAISALICFIISLLFPAIILKFPIIKSSELYNFNYHNLFFSIISTSSYLSRNYGIFWEPGAYSIFLNIALLFELSNKKTRLNMVLVFVISIITTFSTLGIVCCAILILNFILKKQSDDGYSKRIKILFLITCIIVILYLFINGEFFIEHVFGKLRKNSLNMYNVSTITRYNAIVVPLTNFIKNPLFGIGFENYLRMQAQDCFNMATCTFINWICIYGIFGIFLIKYCVNFFLKFNSDNILSKILIFIFAMLLFSTENFLQITFIYIIMFYGFDLNNKKVVKK